MLRCLCVEFRLVSVEYFLDTMQDWEVEPLVRAIPYADRSIWESARLQALLGLQVWSKKELKPGDIMKFAWEEEVQPTRLQSAMPSPDEVAKLKEMARRVKI